MLGQGVGPVIGGILSQYLGFRSIFWFLTIAGSISLLPILVLLSETLRPIAGNGTVPLKRYPQAFYLHDHRSARRKGRDSIGTGEVQGYSPGYIQPFEVLGRERCFYYALLWKHRLHILEYGDFQHDRFI